MKVLKLQEKAYSKKAQASETMRKLSKRISSSERDVRELFYLGSSGLGGESPTYLDPFSCSRKKTH